MHTTVVVDRGLYAVVRHPQYLAGNYLSTFDEERDLRERFGADYEAYCQRVPRIDAATGFLRYLRRTT